MTMTVGDELRLVALPGLPLVAEGDDVGALVEQSIQRAGLTLTDGDVLVVASKLISRAEGRFVDLTAVEPSSGARALAGEIDKDPRLVELIVGESIAVSRAAPGVLIVRHRRGFVMANAGIDASNAVPVGAADGSGPWALLLPEDPDASARQLARRLAGPAGPRIGVIISDSFGRPFRLGTTGVAIGVAGVPALFEQRGRPDLFGRPLEHTVTAVADQIATAADLVAGQGAEGRGAVLVRGLEFETAADSCATELVRPREQDLYA